MALFAGANTILFQCSTRETQARSHQRNLSIRILLLQHGVSSGQKAASVTLLSPKEKGENVKHVYSSKCSQSTTREFLPNPLDNTVCKQVIKSTGKKEYHLWSKRDSTRSGKKAFNLVQIVSGLPNEKEAVYGALDKWTAWETEFPLIAAAKALKILKQRNQWARLIQVAKWMLNKGQGITMATYDYLLLALDMERRVEEAEVLWNMILQKHTRSVSKRLFSRMISLYDHSTMPEKVIEVFADMEELGVKPDENTIKRVSHAFQKVGQEEKRKLVLEKYTNKWKYMHFKGERIRVKSKLWD